jgi:CRP/FNR family cyclic AMP-dependent transcriptional regulator
MFLAMHNQAQVKELLCKLESNELGKFLTQDELDVLIKYSQIREFSPGTAILKQGKETQDIYMIIEGQVNVMARVMGQGITKMETLGPGNFIGEISFVEKVPGSTSAIANSKVNCLVINKIYFEVLSATYPEIKYKLFDALSRQVCSRLKKIHDKVTACITDSNMISQSFFDKVVHTFNQPKAVTFEEILLDKERLWDSNLFRLFSLEELHELFTHMELLEASKNCKLIYEGEKRASCYIVIRGAVQSSIVHDNKMAKLSVIGPETLFASAACVDTNSAFTVTFSTREQTILLRLSDTALQHLQKNKLKIWYKLYGLICTSLVALEKSIDKLDIRLHIEAYNR